MPAAASIEAAVTADARDNFRQRALKIIFLSLLPTTSSGLLHTVNW